MRSEAVDLGPVVTLLPPGLRKLEDGSTGISIEALPADLKPGRMVSTFIQFPSTQAICEIPFTRGMRCLGEVPTVNSAKNGSGEMETIFQLVVREVSEELAVRSSDPRRFRVRLEVVGVMASSWRWLQSQVQKDRFEQLQQVPLPGVMTERGPSLNGAR